MMTGQFPSRHGVTFFWTPAMRAVYDKMPVLAEVFKAHGYRTAAFIGNVVAGRPVTGRGFEDYFEFKERSAPPSITERDIGPLLSPYRAPWIFEQFSTWVDQHAAEPFFTFVLFFEPHSPYNPPPEHDIFKSDAYPDLTDIGYDIKQGHLKRLAQLGDAKATERLHQLYDGKIHYVDAYVGQLTEHLRKLGLDKKTVILLTSDHGELLYERPAFMSFDHRSLYEPVLHVPFIVHGAVGIHPGRVVDALTSSIDLQPTLLELAGLPVPPTAEGRSLVPLMEGKTRSGDPHVFSEQDIVEPLRSVRDQRFKLIYSLWEGSKQLFDLRSDPKEARNIAAQNPQVTQRLLAQLQEWMQQNQLPHDQLLARWKAYLGPQKLTILDEQAIGGHLVLHGTGWHSDENPEDGHWAGGCFWIESGDGSKTAVWRAENPLVGRFEISVYFGRLPQHKVATNAPFTILTESGTQTVRVNFNQGPGEWHLLGTYGNPYSVTLSNATDGVILVDAVKFERLD
jgi:arylsulfatase A-like enzyme